MNNILEFFEFDFSIQGSNAREAEEAIAIRWNEFLTEVGKGLACKLPKGVFLYQWLSNVFNTACSIYSLNGDVEVCPLTLHDVLVFVTGADQIPPMGFDKKLTISFDHCTPYPIASTCSLTIYPHALSNMKSLRVE